MQKLRAKRSYLHDLPVGRFASAALSMLVGGVVSLAVGAALGGPTRAGSGSSIRLDGPSIEAKSSGKNTPSTVYADVADRTAMLVRARSAGDRVELHTYCSAVWIGRSTLITAAHCLADEGPDISVVTWRSTVRAVVTEQLPVMHSALAVARDIVADVAVVQTHDPVDDHAIGGLGEIHAGETIDLMGHPLGAWYTYERGTVARVLDAQLDGASLHVADVAVTVRPGNSGGCVWRAHDCVGVVTRMNVTNGHGLAVGTVHVRRLIDVAHVRVR